MKKISILLVLLMALPAGYLFSAPRPPYMPWPPHKPRPPLVGHWEGTGNFLLTNLMVPPGEETTRTVEVEVLLDIEEQDGNNFIGKITARYMSLLPWDYNYIYIGRWDMPIAGQIQGDSTSRTRPVNMVSGLGDASSDSAICVVEMDGQYEARVSPAQVTLTCRWRGMDFRFGDVGGYSGEPSVGEFTVILQPPPSNVD